MTFGAEFWQFLTSLISHPVLGQRDERLRPAGLRHVEPRAAAPGDREHPAAPRDHGQRAPARLSLHRLRPRHHQGDAQDHAGKCLPGLSLVSPRIQMSE